MKSWEAGGEVRGAFLVEKGTLRDQKNLALGWNPAVESLGGIGIVFGFCNVRGVGGGKLAGGFLAEDIRLRDQ